MLLLAFSYCLYEGHFIHLFIDIIGLLESHFLWLELLKWIVLRVSIKLYSVWSEQLVSNGIVFTNTES